MLDHINEELRKLKQLQEDQKYEIQGLREGNNRLERKVEDNQRKNDQEIQMAKVKHDALDSQVQALKKMMQKLNEQHKEMLKSAASGGNPMAAGMMKNLEDELNRLKAELAT